MRVDIITLFPEVVTIPLGASIMGRAQEKGALELQVHDLREHGRGKYRQVDDEPYGGGPGMVMRPEPIAAMLDQLKSPQARVIFMSPQGKPFTQADAVRLSTEDHLVFLCGHYEGVDQRVVDTLVDEELSIGDYVLTNGAIAAVVVVDAIVRLLPGVLGDDQSAVEESFGSSGLLDHPHYTRPAEWNSLKVPDVLVSGDHAKVAKWRAEQALERTRKNRPDLLK